MIFCPLTSLSLRAEGEAIQWRQGAEHAAPWIALGVARPRNDGEVSACKVIVLWSGGL
jgi:hypothetical protein